jgi:protein-tyrosine phosphatase
MAQYIFQNMVNQVGLSKEIRVDSAGTNVDTKDSVINVRAINTLRIHNIPHNQFRSAQKINDIGITEFDYILALDQSNFRDLEQAYGNVDDRLGIFLNLAYDLGEVSSIDVPDPWRTGQYELTYGIIEIGCGVLIEWLITQHHL